MTTTDRFVLQEAKEWHAKYAEMCRTKAEVLTAQGEHQAAEDQRRRQEKHLAVRDALANVLRAEKPKGAPVNGKSFNAPSDADVVLYGQEIGLPKSEAMKFHDHFQSNGWKVSGKAVMKDWKAALRNWQRNFKERQPQAKRPTLPPPPQRPV